MSKKYDLSKKSDMRRFERDLADTAMDLAMEYAKEGEFEIECPHCGKAISIPVGESDCPECGGRINLSFQE